MKRILFFLFLGVFFLVLQTTWLASLPLRKIQPDLVLILTLYLGFTSPPISGGILSFFLGFLMDLFSGNCFGLYAFSRPLLFCGVQLFKDRIYLESFFPRFLFVFFFALAEGVLLLALLKALNPEPLGNLYPAVIPLLLFQSSSTALVSPILFSLVKKGFLCLQPQRRAGMGKG